MREVCFLHSCPWACPPLRPRKSCDHGPGILPISPTAHARWAEKEGLRPRTSEAVNEAFPEQLLKAGWLKRQQQCVQGRLRRPMCLANCKLLKFEAYLHYSFAGGRNLGPVGSQAEETPHQHFQTSTIAKEISHTEKPRCRGIAGL